VVIVHGKRHNGAAKTRPNIYRLTFLPDYEGGWPSEEWRRHEPSKGAGDKAWATALARTKDVARTARRRRHSGKVAFRSEAEADAAIAPAESVLKRLGKKIGRPGNKQTRAAISEAAQNDT
jgi:hypothetical protein